MLNVEMQTYTYVGSTIVQIYYTILADIVRHSIQAIKKNRCDLYVLYVHVCTQKGYSHPISDIAYCMLAHDF